MDYDAFMEIVRETRSIRRFKPDPVTEEQVDQIVEAGRWAPSGFNQQPWEFVVVRDPGYRARIATWYGEYMDQTRVMETTREEWQRSWVPEPTGSPADFSVAPVFILVLGDDRTRAGLPMSMRYNAARQEYVFSAGLSNALLYMHMAASVLGLASQWVSGVASPYLHCLIKDLVGIPEYLQVYDMLAVGHPAVRPRRKLLRDRAEVVHHDHCGPDAFRSDEEVRDWVRKARAWTMASHARQADEPLTGETPQDGPLPPNGHDPA